MIKEVFGFGDTLDEAKEDAVSKLGASPEDDINYEIIDMPKKKLLGVFGGNKAKVRAFVEKPDAKAKRDKKPNKKAVDKQPAETAKPVVAEKKVEKKADADKEYGTLLPADKFAADSSVGLAVAYLSNILEKLGCKDIVITAAEKDNSALINLEGEGLGVIIGRRGETLDSLQYLTSLAANNGNGYFKVTLNIGNYREKREQTLIALANRVSQQVIKTNRSRGLEPMNPYERRIIHTAVQSIDGVVSNSVGEGNRRRVVIFPEGGDMRPSRENRYNRSDRGGKKDSNVVRSPDREPKRDSDVPLYGKIN